MTAAKSTATIAPNLGLYLDRPPLAIMPNMLQDGMNFRVYEGRLNNLNIGWQTFDGALPVLNGPVMLIDDFIRADETDTLIFGTTTDLYKYDPVGHTVVYITPTYHTGTASASGTAVTGSGSSWSTTTPRAVKAGDQISFGNNNVVSTTATWYTVDTVNSDTSITLTASAGTVSGGNYTIRLLFQGDQSNNWNADTFLNASPENTDQWFATNGVDLPVYWDSTTAQVKYLNNNFTCTDLLVYEDTMVYLNVVQGGTALHTSMINSDENSPKNTSTGIANQFIVHSDPGPIYGGAKLGQSLVVYSKNVVTLVTFVGAPVFFTFLQITFDRGIIAGKAIATFPNYHEYLGRDTMYRFDGATITPINTHIWRSALSQQDPTRQLNTYTHRDEQTGEYFWVLPSTVDPGSGSATAPPSQAFVEHYLEQVPSGSPTVFSKRTHIFTATGRYSRQAGLTWNDLTNSWTQYNFKWNDQFFAAQFPLNVAGDVNGNLYTFNSAQDANGTALNSYIRFGRRALFDGRMRGLVTRVYPFAELFSNSLTVTCNLADFAGGPATISQAQAFDQSEQTVGQFFVPIYRAGRFFDVQMGTAGPSQPWVIDGYDYDVKPGGMR